MGLRGMLQFRIPHGHGTSGKVLDIHYVYEQ